MAAQQEQLSEPDYSEYWHYPESLVYSLSSELSTLCSLPLKQTNLEHIAWVEGALREREANSNRAASYERNWLAFMLELMRWHRQFDVLLEEASG